MISSLYIQNYALIKELNISPDERLNIITGETGAGKSIMLGALGLLMGKRADSKVLLDHQKKCVVEGTFQLGKLDLKSHFEECEIEYDEETIIRREISPSGKSRAFINDSPVTLDVVKATGLKLIDIHSQNESVQLGDKLMRLQIIDDFSRSGDVLYQYQKIFSDHSAKKKELESLESRKASAKKDADYKRFLLDELLDAELKSGEQEKIEEELNVLENSEDIKLKLSHILGTFDGNESTVNDMLRETSTTLTKISPFSENLSELSERFHSAAEEIVDIIRDLSAEQDRLEHDPERIALLSERLDLIQRLQQKHQVSTTEQLIDIQENLEAEAVDSVDAEERIAKLNQELVGLNKEMISAAESLSEVRRTHMDLFSAQINEMLGEVGMPNGRLEIAYKRIAPSKWGIDEVEMLFSANKGINPEPVSRVASGGEFSRLMFCVKYLLAEKTAMPTVVFDEIDTGVSGGIAIKLAVMMKKMAQNHQIISISHLPQIAAKGDAHYFVYKNNEADTTESLIKRLDEEERLDEIAKMIGGDSPSEIAKESARELIAKT